MVTKNFSDESNKKIKLPLFKCPLRGLEPPADGVPVREQVPNVLRPHPNTDTVRIDPVPSDRKSSSNTPEVEPSLLGPYTGL